ncbi:MAG: KH domain-containing protein [Candidatus Woykebacteria bacterium]
MKDLIEFLVKNIVSEPERIEIKELESENGEIIQLKVAKDDMGKIIGKGGRTIKALRTLLKIKAIKTGRRAYLELSEPSQP